MTVYAYKCTAANHEIEQDHPIGTAPSETTCPDHDAPARKLLSKGTWAAFPGSYRATTR